MRKRILAGNWKMNLNYDEAKSLFLELNRFVITHDQVSEVIIAPPYLYLGKAVSLYHNNQIKVAAQDISERENGAYTGEISAQMVRGLGVRYVILGHSERRQFHYETDETLKNKVDIALSNDLRPIYCCGESLNHREKKITLQVINSQLKNSLFHLSEEDFSKVVIAYEPVWAIGTGKVATPEQAQEVHKYIRETVEQRYGNEIADNLSILYGGSLKPDNASQIFQEEDVDGGLVGGASLNSKDFTSMVLQLDKSY